MGKTNLLEALHVGTQGFSPRTRAEGQLLRFGAGAARVGLAGTEREAKVETEVVIRRGEGKRIRVNGAPLTGADELRGRLSALAFTPDRLAVVKGSPFVRRAYFDRSLGRVFPARAPLPGEYGRALAQRNAALRRARAGVSSPAAAAPWTARVAALGDELDRARAELVALLAPLFGEQAAVLCLDDAVLSYEARGLAVDELERRLPLDLERGTTSAGPHLRDVGVTAGGRDLRSYGSQGEQRAAVLALVLAEAALLADRRGSPPLLLLDDVLSELDESRRRALLASLPPGGQAVATATSRAAVPAGARPPDLVVAVAPGEAKRA